MKVFLSTLICGLLLLGSLGVAQEAYRLYGLVEYSTGGDVGPNRPVLVYTSTTQYQTTYTNASGMYGYSFYPPQYFYKVMCGFTDEEGVWRGETIINATLTTSTRYDITVYKIGDPPKF